MALSLGQTSKAIFIVIRKQNIQLESAAFVGLICALRENKSVNDLPWTERSVFLQMWWRVEWGAQVVVSQIRGPATYIFLNNTAPPQHL